MDRANLKYDKRLVAFIDILGFKEIIKQSETDSTKIELIYSVLKYLKNWETPEYWDLKFVEIEESAQRKGVNNFDIRRKTNCTAFSDSIIISVQTDNDINEMTSTLIVNLAYIGAVLLEQGILIRGAITIGELIHDDNGTVFGQGLIDSYQLENNYSKYPRVILSDKLIAKLNYPINTKRNHYPYHQYVDRFLDGCVGFHQMIYYQVMENWAEMTKEKLIDSLAKIRKVIIDGLDISFEKPEIFEKYNWLKEQYNKLIILSDFDFDSKTEENIKIKIRELNENTFLQNIHFKYTDEAWEKIRIRKMKRNKYSKNNT